ncbi:MAG: DUF2007 domain-containing protein [Clostridiaceae bacterium]|nr:DUF2007 domain-containing protein [Clostridiaceae bacterium]
MSLKNKESDTQNDIEYLMTAADNIEADIIESILKPSGIPVLKKYRETGHYMTLVLGKSNYGIDLFVPGDRVVEARELVKTAGTVEDKDILSDPSFRDEKLAAENEEFLKTLGRRNLWMAAIFIAAAAVLIYMVVTNM